MYKSNRYKYVIAFAIVACHQERADDGRLGTVVNLICMTREYPAHLIFPEDAAYVEDPESYDPDQTKLNALGMDIARRRYPVDEGYFGHAVTWQPVGPSRQYTFDLMNDVETVDIADGTSPSFN